MRLDAHPLIVAVALGLLGPAALSEGDDDDGARPVTVTDPQLSELSDGAAVTIPSSCAEAHEDCVHES